VAIPSLFMNLTEVTDLTSIGTLFAFVLVSGGVLVLQNSWKKNDIPKIEKGFQVPYFNSRYFLPVIWVCILALFFYWNRAEISTFYFQDLDISRIPDLFILHFPILIFLLVAGVLTWFGIRRELSLIPVLGLLTNFYLMAQLGITNWLRFLLWLAVGLVIYFSYGRRDSKLEK
jgi:basic amino acid/polyamine antiporter, APA family